MDISIIQAWKKVVDTLTLSVGQKTIDLWFKDVKPVSFNENVFTISVPNNFFSNWLKKNQQSNIEHILKTLYSKATI